MNKISFKTFFPYGISIISIFVFHIFAAYKFNESAGDVLESVFMQMLIVAPPIIIIFLTQKFINFRKEVLICFIISQFFIIAGIMYSISQSEKTLGNSDFIGMLLLLVDFIVLWIFLIENLVNIKKAS